MNKAPSHTLEFKLLNDYQHRFPLCSSPFSEMAQALESTEATILQAYSQLLQAGRISRIGAVFAPQRIGASTLAALSVPPDRLAKVAAMVSRFPEVNHNYEREHRFNLWFVVTACSSDRLAAVLAQIESLCALPVLRLPLEEQFHIDLGFCLGGAGSPRVANEQQRTATATPIPKVYLPDAKDQALINVLQEGLPLVSQPYAQIARKLQWTEQQVLGRLASWLHTGLLKRFGVVVRHHELGYTANAMVVHDIPDALVSTLGRQIGKHPSVTLCYRRPRVGTDWPYNLFCMLHGRERAEVEQHIAQLRSTHGLENYPHAVLFSRTRYKQQGAYYADFTPIPASAAERPAVEA